MKKTIKQLKTKAWELCSIFNRTKDADWRGYVKCCTCGKQKHWSEGDAGHFLSGRCNAILFEDDGIHFQCKQCNNNSGEQYLYGKFMESRYGEETIKRLYNLKHNAKNFKLTRDFLEDKIKYYETNNRD